MFSSQNYSIRKDIVVDKSINLDPFPWNKDASAVFNNVEDVKAFLQNMSSVSQEETTSAFYKA